MNSPYTWIPVLLAVILSAVGSELDYDGWLRLRVWHALNKGPMPNFIERGNITVTSVRSGASTVAQAGLKSSELDELRKLAEDDREYRLKASVRGSSGTETTFFTSVPACLVLGSELEDFLTVWLDGAAEPVAVSLSSYGPCSREVPSTQMWTTEVQVRYPEAGPVPDTATYIQKLEREREARERGETKDNRSFLAKYWMYIVPAVIFVLLSSATNPEAGGAGGGGGGAQR
ncbi:ER membrane protein complex subunit 10 [Neodiprion lecontei]|uniref:ER membrane protein complex subunit 10 n=1 Tax=Neodiprion lecontei TaxID=441921 RepID=A0A6J0BDN2_NEOLC|nr:ER membrane protein complex subunit 10 [Neodiprion lecontei]XP_046429554.1 ER membrane protein complex subunit 10 [Neodiprion fabricii]